MNRCDSYVDMGEHNKPLCKRKGYRPAECELCPTRVASLEAENAKLRELVHTIWLAGDFRAFLGVGELEVRMRELGIEV